MGYIKKLETWKEYFGHPKFQNSYFLGYISKNSKILRKYRLHFEVSYAKRITQIGSLQSELWPFESLAVKRKMQFGNN